MFDREGLQIAMDHILTHGWEDAFQYGLSEGNPELRAAICQIMLDRGIHCGVENVVVTSGSQQSLDILARALINPGDVVVLERPTYLAALQVFQLAEANLLSVGTDAEGMIVDELETLLLSTRIKAVYIVPTFGNPEALASRSNGVNSWWNSHYATILSSSKTTLTAKLILRIRHSSRSEHGLRKGVTMITLFTHQPEDPRARRSGRVARATGLAEKSGSQYQANHRFTYKCTLTVADLSLFTQWPLAGTDRTHPEGL